MYCAAPGWVQPSAGKMQTVTAISEFVGDAGGVVAGADVAGLDVDGEVAGVVAVAWVVAVRDGGAWPVVRVDVVGSGASTTASVAPIAAAATAAPPIASSQRRDEPRPGPVLGETVLGYCPGGAVVPAR